jgi:hypothetical protein
MKDTYLVAFPSEYGNYTSYIPNAVIGFLSRGMKTSKIPLKKTMFQTCPYYVPNTSLY